MKSSIVSRKQETVAFFSSFFCHIDASGNCKHHWSWCSAAGKKNKFLSYPKSGRSGFGLVIISGILAVIIVLLAYRTLRNFEL